MRGRRGPSRGGAGAGLRAPEHRWTQRCCPRTPYARELYEAATRALETIIYSAPLNGAPLYSAPLNCAPLCIHQSVQKKVSMSMDEIGREWFFEAHGLKLQELDEEMEEAED